MAGVNIATAYIQLVPSVQNLQGNISKALAPAQAEAGKAGTAAGGSFAKGFGGNLGSAEAAAGASGHSSGAALGKKLMTGFMAVGVAGGIVSSLKGTIDTYMESAVDVNKLKRLTGGSTEDTSRLTSELKLSGVAADSGTTAIQKFSKALGTAATDSGKTADMTALLGQQFVNADGSVKPLTELMGPLADKFKAMPNGAEKTALAMKLFGKSGTDMLPFLNKGAEGLAELGQKSDDFGLTLNDQTIGAMGDAKQQSREFDAAMQGMQVTMGSLLLPVLTAVQKFIQQYVIPVFKTMSEFIKDNSSWLMPLIGGLLALVGAFKIGTTIVAAFNAVMAANPIVLIVLAVAALVAAIIYAYNNFDTFKNIVQTAWDVIQNVATWAWNNILKPIFDAIVVAVQALGAVFSWLWTNAIQPAWDGIQNVITFAWDYVLMPLFEVIKVYIGIWGAIFTFLWQNIIQPAWDGIQNVITWAWNNILAPLFEVIKADIAALGAVFTFLWNYVVQPAWDGIQNIITWAWNNVIAPLFEGIKTGINALGAVFTWLWNEVVVPAWDGIKSAIGVVWDFIRDYVFAPFQSAVGAIGGWFETAASAVSTAWDKIKEYASVPIKWVINTVWNDGIRSAWNAITGWIPGIGDSLKLDPITLSFAGGGIAPGYAPGHDIVNARLSPGEAVLVPELTRSLLSSGVDILGANKAARAGGDGLAYFADGGFFDNIWPDNITGSGPLSNTALVGPTVGEAAGAVKDLASFTAAFASDPLGTIMGMLGPDISNGLTAMASSPWAKTIAQMPGQAIGGLINVIKSWFASSANASVVSGELNLSQNPSDYGWAYPPTLADMSWSGKGLTIAAGTEGLWTGLLDTLNPNIQGGITNIGGYDDRQNVNNPSAKSLHAYGLAVDVNAPENPNGVAAYGRVGPGVIPSALAPIIAKKFGMIWGGDFTGTPDGMHFEIHVTPGQIGAGGTVLASGNPGQWGTTAGMQTNLPSQWMDRGTLEQVGPIPPGGALERWRPMYLDAIAFQNPAVNIDNMMEQMRRESSGDPLSYAIDSNYYAGHPSKSLLQVIGPTFTSNAAPGFGTNIWDPWSNALASLNYIKQRKFSNVYPGGAYDGGGWLGPGGVGVNLTRTPEPVLTPQQWDVAEQAINHAAAGGGQSIVMHVYQQPGQDAADLAREMDRQLAWVGA